MFYTELNTAVKEMSKREANRKIDNLGNIQIGQNIRKRMKLKEPSVLLISNESESRLHPI